MTPFNPDPASSGTNFETEDHNYELVYEFEADGKVRQRLQCKDCEHISDGWRKVEKEELW